MHHTFNRHRFTTESYSTVISNENIKSQGVIATQKHQLPQQPIAHSCPGPPHEQPTGINILYTGAEEAADKFSKTVGELFGTGILCNFSHGSESRGRSALTNPK